LEWIESAFSVLTAESLLVLKITSEGLQHIIKVRTNIAEESYKFISIKDSNFINFGLKRTPITVLGGSLSTSRI
jgi:hypothetical protein